MVWSAKLMFTLWPFKTLLADIAWRGRTLSGQHFERPHALADRAPDGPQPLGAHGPEGAILSLCWEPPTCQRSQGSSRASPGICPKTRGDSSGGCGGLKSLKRPGCPAAKHTPQLLEGTTPGTWNGAQPTSKCSVNAATVITVVISLLSHQPSLGDLALC